MKESNGRIKLESEPWMKKKVNKRFILVLLFFSSRESRTLWIKQIFSFVSTNKIAIYSRRIKSKQTSSCYKQKTNILARQERKDDISFLLNSEQLRFKFVTCAFQKTQWALTDTARYLNTGRLIRDVCYSNTAG